MPGILDIFGRLGQLYMAMEQGKQSRAQRLYTQQQAALEAARQQQKELQPLQEQVAGLAGLALPSVQAAFPGATVTQLPTQGMSRSQLTGIAGQLFPVAQQNVPQGMAIQGPGGLSYTPPKLEPVPTDTPQTRRAAREAQLRSVVVNYGANPELVATLPESRLAPMALSMSRGLLTQKTDPKTGEPIYTLGEFTPLEVARTAGVEATTARTWGQVELLGVQFDVEKVKLASDKLKLGALPEELKADLDLAQARVADLLAGVDQSYQKLPFQIEELVARTENLKATAAGTYYMMTTYRPSQLKLFFGRLRLDYAKFEEDIRQFGITEDRERDEWKTPSGNVQAQQAGATARAGARAGGSVSGTPGVDATDATLRALGAIP